MITTKSLFTLILVTLLVTSCKNKPDYPVVASWDEIHLATDVFKKQYISYASTAPVKDDFQVRKNYASYLLEQLIIADIAKKSGIDQSREVQLEVKLRRDYALRQQYMRNIIEERVNYPQEMEVREAYRIKNTHILLEQIYASSKNEIDSIYTLIKKNGSFDELARKSMRKYNPNEADSSYKMGWVTYGGMDLKPEKVAFSLQENQYSEPVQSLNGWHIFKAKRIRTTSYVDVGSYANERESLGYNLYKRRFEEASQRYLDSTLSATPLKINAKTLREVWTKIEPWIKKADPSNLSIMLTIESGRYEDESLPRSTPLAEVGGATYTLGQFLDELQLIPRFMIRENLIEALEFALKDSIFAKRAETYGYLKNPIVQLEEKSAYTNALYFAQLRNTVDTLSMERIKDEYFEKWKKNYFVDSVTTIYHAYIYPDSVSAWKTIQAWKEDENFKNALDKTKQLFVEEIRTTTTSFKEMANFPEHNLPMESDKMDKVFAGPYLEKSGKYILIAPKSRSYTFQNKANIADKLDEVVKRNLSQITHEQLLPKSYSYSDIEFNQSEIDGIAPYYFEKSQK